MEFFMERISFMLKIFFRLPPFDFKSAETH